MKKSSCFINEKLEKDNINLLDELYKPEYFNEVMSESLIKGVIPSKDFDYVTLLKKIYLDKFKWQPPRLIEIPKDNGSTREIFIFNEDCSILLKVINKIMCKVNKTLVNPNVFSYQKGLSIKNVAKKIQYSRDNMFFAKIDISNYFRSVDKRTIISTVEMLTEGDSKGRSLLMDLYNIDQYIDVNGNLVKDYLSLMPGSAFSSFMSNIVLGDIDEWLSSKCDFYSRYSDDILIGSYNKDDLKNIEKELEDRLSNKNLKINNTKTLYYNKEEPVVYLGLTITKDRIVLSPSNTNKVKRLIRNTCREYRFKCVKKKGNKLEYVKKCIENLNKKFYKSVFDNSQTHKGNRISFIFNCVTDVDFIKELDYYIKDRLNWIYTGKNNSKYKLNQETLEGLGFVPLTKMYYLFKADRELFFYECWKTNKVIGVKDMCRPSRCYDNYKRKPEVIKARNWEEFLNIMCTKNLSLLIDDEYKIQSRSLKVDFIDKTVKLGEMLISRAGVMLISRLNLLDILGYPVTLLLEFDKIEFDKVSSEVTRRLYLNVCACNNNTKTVSYNYVRVLKNLDLINLYNDFITNYYSPSDLRNAEFYSYLLYININNMWDKAGFTEKFNYKKYELDDLKIVLQIT